MQKKWKRILIGILVVIILGAGAYLMRDYIKPIYHKVMGNTVTYYQDNVKLEGAKLPDYSRDVQEVDENKYGTTYVNYPKGYLVKFPGKVFFDFSLSNILTKGVIEKNDTAFTITREYSPYPDKVQYIADYTNRFMMDPKFIEENQMTIHQNKLEQVGDYQVQTIIFTREAPESSLETRHTYAHCYIYTESQLFFRLTFNTAGYSGEFAQMVADIIQSFDDSVAVRGSGGIYQEFRPEIPEGWNQETKKVYQNIVESQDLTWGIFRPQAVRDDRLDKIEAVEQKIDNKFAVALEYIYFGEDFPSVGMQKAYEQGRMVELTMQISTVMHANLNGYNPFFEVLDGERDDYIHQFAKDLKAFGHPFIFRLNNEMNSDWTSYGGAAILNEPELFKKVWVHIYEIFEQEGVDNAIWIFNANDRNSPPNEYNHFINYYPGNKYVQMFGITGYNTGTYYADVFGEDWREFKDIYDKVYQECYPYFYEFPWMITEFSSSSVGGDKPQWIERMFEEIGNYPNLKIAVWFCSVDMDFRPGREEIIARPYLLDENEECVQAFKNGLEKSGYQMKSIFE